MRKALVQLHLWTGLVLGLYVLVSSVTGAVLVFHEELAHVAQASLHEAAAGAPGARPPLTMDDAAAALAQALPDARVLSLAPPAAPGGTFQAGILANGYRLAFIDPGTGAVIGPVAPGGEVLSWMHEVHANLLSGRTGRVANGVGGLLLVLLGLTGLVIWWPRPGGWRRALWLKPGVGWKRLVFDLHHVVGFWLLVPVVGLSLTGTYFTWPAQYRTVIGWMSPAQPLPVPTDRSGAGRAERPVSLDAVLTAAQSAVPSLEVARIGGVAGGPAQPFTVFLRPHGGGAPIDETRVFVSRQSGTVLEVRPPRTYASAGDAVASWLGPLHTGHFGGPVIKTLWAVAGLAPAMLFFTGFLMWWHRVVQPWQRRSARRAASTAAETISSRPW